MPKAKKNSLSHLTEPTAKLNQQERETLKKLSLSQDKFSFSLPLIRWRVFFSSDWPLIGSDGAVKVMALTVLKTSEDTQALIGRCLPLLLNYHSPTHEIPSFSLRKLNISSSKLSKNITNFKVLNTLFTRCCRHHDLGCPRKIGPGETVGGITNKRYGHLSRRTKMTVQTKT